MEESSLIILVLLIILLYLYYNPNYSASNDQYFQKFRTIRRSLDPDTLFEGFAAEQSQPYVFPTSINRDVELNTERGLKGDPYYFIANPIKKIKIAEASGYNMKWKYLSIKYDATVKITMYTDDPNITLRVPLDVSNTTIADLQTFASNNGFSSNANIWLEIDGR
jgi:hypothetical protein